MVAEAGFLSKTSVPPGLGRLKQLGCLGTLSPSLSPTRGGLGVASSIQSKVDFLQQIPYDMTYMWNLKYDTNELTYETETDSQT